MTMRARIYRLFEMQGPAVFAAQLLNVIQMTLILISVCAVIPKSVEAFRQLYAPGFESLQVILVAAFTVEYLYGL